MASCGIAPTSIIVRAGSGKTVEAVDHVVSTLHSAEAPRGRATYSGMEAEAGDRELLDLAEKVRFRGFMNRGGPDDIRSLIICVISMQNK
ncbi:hypothetical protein WG66_007861 [Moniliophthora roreri]|nr:hypothetical protein WG66_007861 [Moniliophthora roreri]